MFHFPTSHFLPLLIWVGLACNGQASPGDQEAVAAAQRSPRVGGNCDTCELMFIGMPENMNATDTSAGWNSPGRKIKLTGTVYAQDGTTPKPDVVIYYWQTNDQGLYAEREGLDPRVRRHGYIRGWVKSNEQGQYTIYTIRPGSYPNSSNPEHIHLLVKEPDLPNEYYIDDIVFDDDTLLTKEERRRMQHKGGSGIVQLDNAPGVPTITRDLILGKNIDNYPVQD